MVTTSIGVNPRFPRLVPVLPREHGAWVMLFGPMLLGFLVTRGASTTGVLLLASSALFLFLAQDGLRSIVRGKADQSVVSWTAVTAASGMTAGAALALRTHPIPLACIAAGEAVLFAGAIATMRRRGGKRFDRSLPGELTAVLALTATGPAAALAGGASLRVAIAVYVASLVLFGSGVMEVEMLLNIAKRRSSACIVNSAYHLGLALAIFLLMAVQLQLGVWFLAAATPLFIRLPIDARRPAGTAPSFKRIGIRETLLAAWFVACAAVAIRHLS